MCVIVCVKMQSKQESKLGKIVAENDQTKKRKLNWVKTNRTQQACGERRGPRTKTKQQQVSERAAPAPFAMVIEADETIVRSFSKS